MTLPAVLVAHPLELLPGTRDLLWCYPPMAWDLTSADGYDENFVCPDPAKYLIGFFTQELKFHKSLDRIGIPHRKQHAFHRSINYGIISKKYLKTPTTKKTQSCPDSRRTHQSKTSGVLWLLR